MATLTRNLAVSQRNWGWMWLMVGRYSQGQQPPSPGKVTSPPSQPQSACLTQESVTYKVPEYYSFNRTSYYDFDVDMANHRLKQPSKYMPPTFKTK